MGAAVLQGANSRVSKEEGFLWSWKCCVFQQKRKSRGGEVKGHYFGNELGRCSLPCQEPSVRREPGPKGFARRWWRWGATAARGGGGFLTGPTYKGTLIRKREQGCKLDFLG